MEQRREAARFNPNCKAKLEWGDRIFETEVVVNLSLGGAQIGRPQGLYPTPGQACVLLIEDGTDSLDIEAEIVWAEETRIGLSVSRIRPAARVAWNRLLSRLANQAAVAVA